MLFILAHLLLLFVETVALGNKCHPTHSDIYGPFYYPNPPKLEHFCHYEPEIPDKTRFRPIRMFGHVFAHDCKTPIAKVKVEMWQADHEGEYRNSSNCRGFVETDKAGMYKFTTIYPGKYTVSEYMDDYRPAHLHFKFNGKNGHKTLVTQMYFDGDEHLGEKDSCISCSSDKSSLIVKLRHRCNEIGQPDHHCWEEAEFNITLSKGEGTRVSTPENEKDLIVC